MRPRVVAALAAGVVLTACSAQPTAAPEEPTPSSASTSSAPARSSRPAPTPHPTPSIGQRTRASALGASIKAFQRDAGVCSVKIFSTGLELTGVVDFETRRMHIAEAEHADWQMIILPGHVYITGPPDVRRYAGERTWIVVDAASDDPVSRRYAPILTALVDVADPVTTLEFFPMLEATVVDAGYALETYRMTLDRRQTLSLLRRYQGQVAVPEKALPAATRSVLTLTINPRTSGPTAWKWQIFLSPADRDAERRSTEYWECGKTNVIAPPPEDQVVSLKGRPIAPQAG